MDQVHIKLIGDLEGDYPLADGQGTFCYWINQVRNGGVVYLSDANIDCRLARFKLGYEQDKQHMADVLVQWNDAITIDDATQYLEYTITVPRYSIIAIGSCLKSPDVILYIGTPEDVMRVVRTYSRKTGKRVTGYVSALGAVCGELVAVPMVLGEPSLSIGCGGSRKRLFKNHEIAVAFPAELASVLKS
jgi:uncharacterized protein (DUF169 family)